MALGFIWHWDSFNHVLVKALQIRHMKQLYQRQFMVMGKTSGNRRGAWTSFDKSYPGREKQCSCHLHNMIPARFSHQQMKTFLTHWGRVTHICIGNLTIIGPDNGLSPGRRQAIIWTNAGILLIGPWGTNFSENLSDIHTFSFNKMHLKMLFGKWRPFCLGLNVLN